MRSVATSAPEGLLIASAAALWLGVLTSISPCPLATNIAAVSFIARQVGRARLALLSGTAYIAGRAIAYSALGTLVVAGVLSVPGLSTFLQRYMNKALGPLLILVGMFLLDLLGLNFSNVVGSEALRQRAGRSGVAGAFLLGVLFALSFCPISAALFFGSLIPLSLREGSRVLLPLVYGIGTGLPVLLLALPIAWGSEVAGRAFQRLTAFERWARLTTGVVFVIIGIYLTMKFVFLG